jgi:hypothetical protein
VRVFISKEQTKETDEGVGSLFLSGLQNSVGGNEVWTLFVIAELLSETQGGVSKGDTLPPPTPPVSTGGRQSTFETP